jgi:hypothetical protein
VAPPLPIPNREVKHFSAYDTFGLSPTGQWVKAGELEYKNSNKTSPKAGIFCGKN